MSFFGVELNSQLNRLYLEIRLKLSQNKFVPNFRTIYRSFAQRDPQISGLISSNNFDQSLNENGIFLKKYEIQVFEKAFEESGLINWFSFLGQLREPMGPVRRQLVEEIFDSIDSNKEGKVQSQQLSTKEKYLVFHFNPNEIDVFKKGIKSEEEIQNAFLSLLNIPEHFVTREEFISFYDDCNINFHHNHVFIRFVSSQWNYTPQKLEEAKNEEVRVASKELRAKLLQKGQATKNEYLIRKLFEEFDLNSNYSIGAYEFDLLLKKFNMNVAPKIVEPLLEKVDVNKTGFIEYSDFKNFIEHDPFPI